MTSEIFIKRVIYFCRFAMVAAVVLFIYAMLQLREDTMNRYSRLDIFTQQCEASGNHMEIHNVDKGVPHYGCYEAPKAKLIKEFE